MTASASSPLQSTTQPTMLNPIGRGQLPVSSISSAPIIPNLPFGSQTGPVGRASLDAVAQSVENMQLSAAAAGQPLRILYGTVRIGAWIGWPVVYNNVMLLPCFHGVGPIDSVVSMDIDDSAPATGITKADMLGEPSPSVNSTLAAAWSALGRTYTDTYPNVAWSLAQVPAGQAYGFSTVNFTIKGRLVYDPRDGAQDPDDASTWTWSDNPALCLADFITSKEYGRGEAIDWDSVSDAADYCDELLGTMPNQEKRRTLNLVLDQQYQVDQWEEALRSYAGCWVVRNGSVTRLVIDEPADSVRSIDTAKFLLDTISIKQRDPEDAPTVVTLQYTDTTVKPWNTNAQKTAKASGVDAGSVPYSESVVQWPGCTSPGMAYREALRRLKEAQLCDLAVAVTVLDDSLDLLEGDVIDLSDIEGFDEKPFRIQSIGIDDIGRPVLTLLEYDAGVYSDDTASGPSNPDTSLPSPAAPPQVGALTVAEELFQVQGAGLFNSRIDVTWPKPTYPFIGGYRIEITQAGTLIETATSKDASSPEFKSDALKEGVAYNVNVYLISTTGVLSTVRQASITPQGKASPPSNVANFTAREIGGKVFFLWDLIADLDSGGYEIRQAPTASSPTWDTAELLDSVPHGSNRYVAEGLPAGEFTFFLKSRDGKRTTTFPVGQYSTDAATAAITIDLDTSLFLSEKYFFTAEDLTHVTGYTTRPTPALYFVTDFDDGLGYGADDTDDTTGTFGDSLVDVPFAVPNSASGTESVYTSEAYDFGLSISANWTAVVPCVDLAGASILEVGLSDDDASYTWYTGGVKSGEARFVKARRRTTGTMVVTRDASGPYVTIDAAARNETGTVVTSATDPVTVTLAGKYARAKAILLTAEGQAVSAYYDNVTLSDTDPNTFDVVAMDADDNQVVVTLSYRFEGI